MRLEEHYRKTHSRFYEAIDAIMAKGISQRTICLKTHIDRRNLFAYREFGRVPASWLSAIVAEFGISAEWLLIGKGDMFN